MKRCSLFTFSCSCLLFVQRPCTIVLHVQSVLSALLVQIARNKLTPAKYTRTMHFIPAAFTKTRDKNLVTFYEPQHSSVSIFNIPIEYWHDDRYLTFDYDCVCILQFYINVKPINNIFTFLYSSVSEWYSNGSWKDLVDIYFLNSYLICGTWS